MKTLSEIAKELGLSSATVSYVYNNKWRENRISEKLAKKIKKKLKEENAFPDLLGKQLKTKKTQTIGVVFSDLEHNYNLRILSGIERAIAGSGNVIILGNSQYGKLEKYFIEMMAMRKIDGLILNPLNPNVTIEYISELTDGGVPVVFIDNYIKDYGIPSVTTDNFGETKKITEYCIKKKKKKIVFLGGGLKLQVMRDRYKGYCEAMEKAHLNIPKVSLPDNPGPQAYSMSFLNDIFSSLHPDAVVVGSFIYFSEGFKLIKLKKIKIPEELMIVGFDFPEEFFYGQQLGNEELPPFRTVIQSAEKMGYKAAEMLLKMINKTTLVKKHIFLKGETKQWKN